MTTAVAPKCPTVTLSLGTHISYIYPIYHQCIIIYILFDDDDDVIIERFLKLGAGEAGDVIFISPDKRMYPFNQIAQL